MTDEHTPHPATAYALGCEKCGTREHVVLDDMCAEHAIAYLQARLAASQALAGEMAEALACELGHGRCSKCSPDGGFPDYDTHATALTRYQEATR